MCMHVCVCMYVSECVHVCVRTCVCEREREREREREGGRERGGTSLLVHVRVFTCEVRQACPRACTDVAMTVGAGAEGAQLCQPGPPGQPLATAAPR